MDRCINRNAPTEGRGVPVKWFRRPPDLQEILPQHLAVPTSQTTKSVGKDADTSRPEGKSIAELGDTHPPSSRQMRWHNVDTEKVTSGATPEMLENRLCFYSGVVDAYGSYAGCKPVPQGNVGSIPTGSTTRINRAKARRRSRLKAGGKRARGAF